MTYIDLKIAIYFGFIFLFGFEVSKVKASSASTSSLGSCFRIRYRNASGCDHVLRRGITRERCCAGQPKHHFRRAWSPLPFLNPFISPTSSSPTSSAAVSDSSSSSSSSSSPSSSSSSPSSSSSSSLSPSPTLSQGHGRSQGYSPSSPQTRSSSFENPKQNDVGKLMVQTCLPCAPTCKDVRCGEDKECVMKNGLPKCVCSPKCYLQHKSSVCGTDGRTYSSECQLLKRSCRKKKQLYVKHSGPCQTCRGVKCKRKRTCILDELLKPRCLKCPKSCKSKPMKKKRLICGTDGITYESKCHIKMASCQAGVTINRAYKGPCTEEATCQSVKCWKGESCLQRRDINTPLCLYCEDLNDCPVTTTHICASDRNTYHSWCALRYASCRAKIALTVIPHHHCIKNTSTTVSTDEDEDCLPKIGSNKRVENKIYSQDENKALKNQDISSYFQSLKFFEVKTLDSPHRLNFKDFSKKKKFKKNC